MVPFKTCCRVHRGLWGSGLSKHTKFMVSFGVQRVKGELEWGQMDNKVDNRPLHGLSP